MYLLSVLGIIICFLLVYITQPGYSVYNFLDGTSFMIINYLITLMAGVISLMMVQWPTWKVCGMLVNLSPYLLPLKK